MSSRKKRPASKSGTKKDFFASKKKFENEGFDFIALVAGMVTSLLFILLVWSHFSSTSVEAKALEAVGAKKAGETVASLEDRTFERLISVEDPEKLMVVLNGLTSNSEIDPEKQFLNYQRQVDTANALLVLPLSATQKRSAVIAKIQALTDAYELDLLQKLNQPNLVENLRYAASEHRNDPDSEIASSALLGLFRLEAFELTKVVDYQPDTSEVVKQAIKVLMEHPDIDRVYTKIREIVDFYMFRYDKITGAAFVEGMTEKREELKSTRAKTFVDELSDYLILANSKFQQQFENRFIQGPSGQRQLLETTLELAKSPDGGRLLLGRIDEVAHWFEESGKSEFSKQIYDALTETESMRSDASASALSNKIVEDGIKRLELVDSQFDFTSISADGSPLVISELRGKVVLVFFWSAENAASVDELERLHEDTIDWNEEEIQIVAACVDEKTDNIEPIARKLKRFHFVITNPANNQNRFLEQCPSRIVPRAMLIDRDGTVHATNVPLLNMKSQTEWLVSAE